MTKVIFENGFEVKRAKRRIEIEKISNEKFKMYFTNDLFYDGKVSSEKVK